MDHYPLILDCPIQCLWSANQIDYLKMSPASAEVCQAVYWLTGGEPGQTTNKHVSVRVRFEMKNTETPTTACQRFCFLLSRQHQVI